MAPPVPNKLLALARHDDDDRRLGVAGALNRPVADLADRLLVGAHTVIIGIEAIALQRRPSDRDNPPPARYADALRVLEGHARSRKVRESRRRRRGDSDGLGENAYNQRP